MYRSVASSVDFTTWRFQTFSNSVSDISNRPQHLTGGFVGDPSNSIVSHRPVVGQETQRSHIRH